MTPIDDDDVLGADDFPPVEPPAVEPPAVKPEETQQEYAVRNPSIGAGPVTDQHRINAIRSLTESERSNLARRFGQIADVISEPEVVAGRILAGARNTPGGVVTLDNLLKI